MLKNEYNLMGIETFIQRIFPFIWAKCMPFARVSFLPTMPTFSLSFFTSYHGVCHRQHSDKSVVDVQADTMLSSSCR